MPTPEGPRTGAADPAAEPAGRARERRIWWTSFLGIFLVSSLWALANPPFAGFDEGSQFWRATSVVRLELFPESRPAGQGRAFVAHVPFRYAFVYGDNRCFVYNADVPAGCVPPLERDDGGTWRTYTPYGNYPPLYYLVGLPTLALPLARGFLATRLLSAAVCSALVASAVTAALARRRRYMATGVLVAATPMVLSLFAMINPNAIEIAAAFLMWAALAALTDGRSTPTTRAIVRVVVGTSVLALARPSSLVWVGIIGSVTCVWAGRQRISELLSMRNIRIGLAVTAGVCALGGLWVYQAHYSETSAFTSDYGIPGRSTWWYAAGSLRRTPRLLYEMVSVSGFFDVGAPWFVYAIWALAAVALVVAAFSAVGWRQKCVVIGLVPVILVVQVVVETPLVDDINYWWQGRYTISLAAGILILAGLLADRVASVGRVRWLARAWIPGLAALAVGHVAAFYWILHRHTVGDGAAVLDLRGDPAVAFGTTWHPPGGAWTLVAMSAIATGTLFTSFALMAGAERPSRLRARATEESTADPELAVVGS